MISDKRGTTTSGQSVISDEQATQLRYATRVVENEVRLYVGGLLGSSLPRRMHRDSRSDEEDSQPSRIGYPRFPSFPSPEFALAWTKCGAASFSAVTLIEIVSFWLAR